MALHFFSEGIDFVLKNKIVLKSWIKQVIGGYGFKPGELNFIFVDDPKILEINRKYLNHDYFTDIITFDDSEGELLNGDIFISVDTVNSNSKAYQVTFLEELHRVMIHGILHLSGFDDTTDDLRIKMRGAEDLALQLLYSKFLSK